MLVVSPVAKKATNLPLLATGFALLFGALTVAAGFESRKGLAGCAVFALGALLVTLSELRTARVQGHELVVTNAFGTRRLLARDVFFAHRVVGMRSPSIEVYATDGQQDAALGSVGTSKLARANELVSELTTMFGREGVGTSPLARQLRAVEAAELAEAAQAMAAVKAQTDAFYRSPVWRRTLALVVGGVALYLVVMVTYAELYGGGL